MNEQNKLFINKVNDFAISQPNLKSPDVNWEDFEKDFASRAFLESLMNRLNSLSTRASNSKIMHDYDNYQESLEDYAYTSFKAKSKSVGYEEKFKQLKQFFTKTRKPTPPKEVIIEEEK